MVINGFYSPIHSNTLAKGIASVMLNDTGVINIAGERISRYNLAVKIAEMLHFEKE
jgi:dTDP-4-dehydrorhamnose reductase